MLIKYIDRDSSVISPVNLVNLFIHHGQKQKESEDTNFVESNPSSSNLQKSEILKDFVQKLTHINSDKTI